MKRTSAPSPGPASAERRLDGFIAKFDPDNQKLIRAVWKALQKRFAGCIEFAYDNYNFFVLGYGPTERPSDAIVSMAASANGVGHDARHSLRLGQAATASKRRARVGRDGIEALRQAVAGSRSPRAVKIRATPPGSIAECLDP